MHTVLLVLFFFIAIFLIGLILLQQDKNYDIGSSYTTNSYRLLSNLTFSGDFMTKITAILAILFFITSLALANSHDKKNNKENEQKNFAISEQINEMKKATSDNTTIVVPN